MIESITWIDSGYHIGHEWSNTSVYQNTAINWTGKVVTTGQIIYEDERVVVVGMSHDVENDNWYGAQLIYKPCITERKQL